ncbi:MAG: AI-2E family transporter [Clostridia bacterium]|nr:AI-2E family transporter [Clostridia bacterium]
MREQRGYLRIGLILVTFGVCLFCLLQNIGAVTSALGSVAIILRPILTGFASAFVLNVLMSSIEKPLMLIYPLRRHKKLLRVVSLLITLLLAASVLTLFLLVMVPKLAEAVSLLTTALPASSAELSESLSALLLNVGISQDVVTTVQTYISTITQQAMATLRNSTGQIAGFVLTSVMTVMNSLLDWIFSLIVAIYVLADKERISSFIHRAMQHFFTQKRYESVVRLSGLSFTTFSNFVRGQVLEAIILGVLCFLGMLLFRFPHAAVVSLLVGVTAIIPVFGAWIGGAIAAFLVAVTDPFKGLMLILYIVVLQQLEGNIIYPRVVGSTIGIPGLLVMCAVIIGQGLGGVVGILIAVPLSAVLYTLLRQRVNKPLPAGEAHHEDA